MSLFPISLHRRRWLLAGTVLLGLAALFLGYCMVQARQKLAEPIPTELTDIAPIRLARPDALVVSASLRQLPRDLLAVPLLKATLTEDFVFYYEENENWLSLKGSLRRIAYEHRLDFADQALAWVLDAPVDVALWRGEGGRLDHWLINAQRSGVRQFLELAARAAVDDSQLSRVGELPLPDGGKTPLYRFNYRSGQTVFFAGAGDKLLLFSDPAMVAGYGDAANTAKVWQALLDPRWAASPLRRHFGLEGFRGRHAVVAETAFLSFHYQRFFPAFEAMRFDFDGRHWQSYVRLAPDAERTAPLDSRELWRNLPAAASFCAALPVEWKTLAPILEDVGAELGAAGAALLPHLRAPAGICWYPDGGLNAPLVIAGVAADPAPDSALGRLFAASVGNSFTGQSAESVGMARRGKNHVWQMAVETDFGRYGVTLARHDGWLLFSPDGRLVDNGLAVLGRNRPALGDRLPEGRPHIAAIVTPRTLAQLLLRAARGDLREDREPVLREAAERHLVPRLKALAGFPPYALALPDELNSERRAWQPIIWQTLSDAP